MGADARGACVSPCGFVSLEDVTRRALCSVLFCTRSVSLTCCRVDGPPRALVRLQILTGVWVPTGLQAARGPGHSRACTKSHAPRGAPRRQSRNRERTLMKDAQRVLGVGLMGRVND